MGRVGTSGEEQVRPMTSVGAAGYRTKQPENTSGTLVPADLISPYLITVQRAAIPPIQRKKDEGPEEVAKELEKVCAQQT